MIDANTLEFDLTTPDGLSKLQQWEGNDQITGKLIGSTIGAAAAGTVVGGAVAGAGATAATGSFFAAVGAAIGKIFGKRRIDVPQNRTAPADMQLKFAQAIIASGKRNGAKKLKITVDKDVGTSIGASYVGASIKGQIAADGKFHLEIEYK